ncbi:MAG: hypothetical protein KDG55_03140 [Rhodocyclaceae bacterium]|nr:hypothetical protein [Rhodocyclaceae bacterium]
MDFPPFYAHIPRLRIRDPLAELLGASAGGWLDYGFDDAVRLTGHACPTVAMAYALTVKGVGALYPDGDPVRGSLLAHFGSPPDEGTTGVVASVVTLLTGASGEGGFKGLGGRHVRRGRLQFGADGPGFLLCRDDGGRVRLSAQLDRVPAHPRVGALLPRCVSGQASADERAEFAQRWQARIEDLLVTHWQDDALWQVTPA